METRPLINLLADGAFHSGAELGARLGISRTAVWNHVQAVQKLGIQVDAVRGKGYRIPHGLDLLHVGQLLAGMGPVARAMIRDVEVFDVVDSTNAVAASRLKAGGEGGYACFAECQTAGRGRRGRSWVSPYATSIYFTFVHEFLRGFPAIDGLSLVVGVSVAEALEAAGCRGVGLKWPNDLVAADAKLGGILIEVYGDVGGPCRAVIGVGINVDLSSVDMPPLDQPLIDLLRIGLPRGRRNDLAIALLNGVSLAVRDFERDGLAGFLSRWQRFDCLLGRPVNVFAGGEPIPGSAEGIDQTGGLCVRTEAGVQVFRSGEVSVRGVR